MTTFIYVIFYNLFFLYGRGLLLLIDKLCNLNLINKKISGIRLLFFSPLIFLFFIGNISFISNFLISNKNILYFFLPIIFFNLLKIKNDEANFNYFINFILIPLMLGFSSLDIGMHFDASLYHLNFQNWLRESNLVIGIANIYSPYGWSSLNEYISSMFWIENNFIFLHFIQLIFLTQLFVFLLHNIKSDNTFLKYSSLFILIFGVLDNFGIGGGRNGFYSIQSIGKFDTSFGVIFLIFSLLLLDQISKNNYSKSDLVAFSYLLVFCIQIKLTGLLCGVLYLVYIHKYSKLNKVSYFKLFSVIKIPIILSFLWMIKNLLQSGCLFFTIELACFSNLSWYERGYSTILRLETSEFNNAFLFNQNFGIWFQSWYSFEINRTHMLNFIFSLFIIYIVKKVFFTSTKMNKTIISVGVFYVLINLLIWIVGSPDPRFAHGLFVLIVAFFGFNVTGIKTKILNKHNKNILFSIFLVCVIFTPRINSYSYFLSQTSSLNEVTIPNVEYKEGDFWGEIPIDNECWVNIDCNKFNKKIAIDKIFIFQTVVTD